FFYVAAHFARVIIIALVFAIELYLGLEHLYGGPPPLAGILYNETVPMGYIVRLPFVALVHGVLVDIGVYVVWVGKILLRPVQELFADLLAELSVHQFFRRCIYKPVLKIEVERHGREIVEQVPLLL